MKLARLLFIIGILAVLIYELTEVGWESVLASLPATPWFYVLWIILYLVLPVADTFTYRVLWHIPFWSGLPVLFRKKVYGSDVMNYSGELYVFFWAREQLEKPARKLAKDVRDNVIVSSVVSTIISISVLAGLVAGGQLEVEHLVVEGKARYIIPAIVIVAILVALGLRFRHYLFGLPARMTAKLAGIHSGRIVAVMGLQVAQWIVVLPEIPMRVWLSFLAVQIVINAIPVVPSKDLIFLGFGVGLAETLGAPEAAVAGILLTKSVLDKLANLAIFIYTSIRQPTVRKETRPTWETEALGFPRGTHQGSEGKATSKQHTPI